MVNTSVISELMDLADQAMVSHGLEPHFSMAVLDELRDLRPKVSAASVAAPVVEQDWINLPFCSIDNEETRDLDQLSAAQKEGEIYRIWVALADVDAWVQRSSAIDEHARKNATSVYTGIKNFPMLPERLSNNLTSLIENGPRDALMVEMQISSSGELIESRIYRSKVINFAKLSYHGVSAWLNGMGAAPKAIAQVKGLADSLIIQDEAAQRMSEARHLHGAMVFESVDPKIVVENNQLLDLREDRRIRAKRVIEDLMIAANGAVAKFLFARGFAHIRRVVKTPARWDRIVGLAREMGERLPNEPDAKALAMFLIRRRRADPLRFAELSLSVIKLMGSGEYVVSRPEHSSEGHFGLAVRDYTHSTAPNRRFSDLVTQRLIKAALWEGESPYSEAELETIAAHCTKMENSAQKVERQIKKSAAACLLSSRIGEQFKALITGVSPKGVWARVLHPPIEGKVIQGESNLDVGQRVKVELLSVNVQKGFIDFACIGFEK